VFAAGTYNEVKRTFSLLLGVSILWAVLAVLVLPWTGIPKTTRQWILLVVAGPPLYVLGEAFFGWVFSQKHGHKISRESFSWTRILVAVAIYVAAAVAAVWLGSLVGW
jgi:hypothetical protein